MVVYTFFQQFLDSVANSWQKQKKIAANLKKLLNLEG